MNLPAPDPNHTAMHRPRPNGQSTHCGVNNQVVTSRPRFCEVLPSAHCTLVQYHQILPSWGTSQANSKGLSVPKTSFIEAGGESRKLIG
jgi:hypothetical protein